MEWCKSKCGNYRIESLSAATLPGALNVIREAFCRDESVCIGAGVARSAAAAGELLQLSADAALDGVSLVAVEVGTGHVVAAALNKIQVAAADPSQKPFFVTFAEERCQQESARSLIHFMADVDGRCNLFEKYGDCSLELMFLATLREHRRRGLAQLLCKVSVQLAERLKAGPVGQISARDLGPEYSHLKDRDVTHLRPKFCQAIWTSNITQTIGANLGFNVELTVPFSEFHYDGKTYAERIGPSSPCCEVVSKVIGQ